MKGATNWIILAAGVAAILLIFILEVPLKIVVPFFTLVLMVMFVYDIFKYSKKQERGNVKSKSIIKDGIWLVCGITASIFIWFN